MAINSPQSSSSCKLTSNDLQQVLNALSSISPHKVINFGLALNVTRNEIAAFEIRYSQNMDDCLREILNLRLSQLPPLTWNDIVTALRSPLVKHPDLARVIESQYIPPSSDPHVHLSSDPQKENARSPHRPPHTSVHTSAQSPPQYSATCYPSTNATSTYAPHTFQPPYNYHHLPAKLLSQHNPSSQHPSYNPHNPPPPHPPHHFWYPPSLHSIPYPQYFQYPPPPHNPQYSPQQTPFHPLYPPYPSIPTSSYYPPYQSPQYPPHHPQYQPPQHHHHNHHYPPPQHTPGPRNPQYPPPPSHTHHTDWSVMGYGPPPAKRQSLLPLNSLPSTQSLGPTEATPSMRQFIDYVKTIYRSSEVERDTKVVKWPPTPSKVFINLACIDRGSVGRGDYDDITKAMVRDGNVDVIVRSKRPILLNEVARDVPATDKKVVLVEGAPGVGKSTFAWEFCRRWERGEIAQQYQLVLLLRLRDERMSRAKSLKDLIYHSLENVSDDVRLELIATHGFHALIILEGYDELPERCRSDHFIFPQLIAGKVLPLATIMVTSRPWATGSVCQSHGSRIHQHIEILGFTSQQITEYMESILPPDQVSDLSLYLERYPQIRMCMYIPLNSAIVLTVYQESQAGTECALPTTRTELYTALSRTLLLRYLRGHPEYESATKYIKTFNDLPPVVCRKFSELCKLAYSSIAGTRYHVQLIFNDNDLPSDFDSLGFMDSVTELYVTQGTVSSHNFLHLTFQEFLAAVHISTMSPSDQLEHFQRHEDGRYRVVLRFLAGLTKLTCFSKDTIKNIFTDTGRTSSPYSVTCDVDVTIDLVNWMFEAQSDDVISLLLESKTVTFTFDEYSMLPLDYYSLGYCIAHSQCQWVLSLIADIGKEEVGMFVAGASTKQKASGRVVGLRGWWNDDSDYYMPLSISAEGLNVLFTQWRSVLHLHELHLRLTVPCDVISWPDLSGLRVLTLEIRGKEIKRLDSLLPYLSLESLTISCTGGGNLLLEDSDAIGLHIKSTPCLKKLCVTWHDITAIGDKEMEVISKAFFDNQSLPLERLELVCDGTFTDTAADCLVQFITNTNTLQHLTIHKCIFSLHGLLALAQAIHHNSTLQEKSLEELIVAIDGDNEAKDCAKLVADDIAVHLRCTNISGGGAIALAQTLHRNSTLKWLNLSNNNISDVGAVALAQALHHNSTLKGLYLSNDNISDAGAVALAQALHHNSTLKELNLYGNDAIGKEGTHQLVQALTVNRSITNDSYYSGLRFITKDSPYIGGLRLPRRCEEYATQCTQYTTVKDRIRFFL